jgi:hypothetical protein
MDLYTLRAHRSIPSPLFTQGLEPTQGWEQEGLLSLFRWRGGHLYNNFIVTDGQETMRPFPSPSDVRQRSDTYQDGGLLVYGLLLCAPLWRPHTSI